MLKRGSKEEQIQQYQVKEQKLLKEIEHLGILNDIMTAVFSLIFIEKYRVKSI